MDKLKRFLASHRKDIRDFLILVLVIILAHFFLYYTGIADWVMMDYR